MLSGRAFGYALAVLVAVELFGGGWHPLGGFLLLLTVASQVALLASLGTWLSLVTRNSLRARVLVALVMLFSGGGLNWLIGSLGLSPSSLPSLAAGVAANAPGTWWFLAFTWNDFAAARAAGDVTFTTRLGAATAGILVFASLAGVFWLDTWRRFETKQTG